jgi:hypothetical protein
VLRLWNSRTHVWLAPDRVVVVCFAGRSQPTVTVRQPSTLQARADDYALMFEALEQALKEAGAKPGKATVVLDGRLVRNAVFPLDARVAGRDEVLAYARHRLQKVYGELAQAWAVECSVSDGALVVSAVDQKLLSGITTELAKFGLRPQSIAPYLTQVFNRFRQRLTHTAFWLAVAESKSLSICRVRDNSMQSVRRYHFAGNPAQAFGEILDREANLDADVSADRHIYLYAPLQPKLQARVGGGWGLERLESSSELLRDPALALCLAI